MQNDLVFKGMTRQPYFYGVPMIPIVIGGIFILILAIVVHLIFLLLLFPYYIALYYLTKNDEHFFSVLANSIRTARFTKDKYNQTKTYSATSKYRHVVNPKLSIHPIDGMSSLQDFLPYSTHISKDIIKTEDNTYIATWVIDGVLFDMVEEYYLENEKNSLNNILRTLSSDSVSIYTHSAMIPYSDKLDYEYSSPYLKEFSDAYYANIQNKNLHISLKYLTVVYKPLKTSIDLKKFTKLGNDKKGNDKKEIAIKKFIFQMNEITNRIDGAFEKYQIERLGLYYEKGITYSTQLEFLNFLIAGKFKKIKLQNAPINEYLSGGASNVKFNKSLMQAKFNDGTSRFAKSLEIKEFCSHTYVGILDTLLESQLSYTITQSFVPMVKRDAKNALSLQKGRLVGSQDDGLSQIEELSIALDDLISDRISFGEYHFSIMIYGDTIEEVKKNTETMTVKLEDIGHLVTQSDMAFPATYFAQFPSNFYLRPRVSIISSLNFATFLSFHTFLFGRRDKNCWGEAITILPTPSKSPYYFNLHKTINEDDFGKFNLGNTLIIGQAGTGKTAFQTFLLNMMMKYDNKNTYPTNIDNKYKQFSAIYLDKDYGAMTNILAAGGKYITLINGEETGFNPFMCPSSKRNINKLQKLIKLMIGTKVKITPLEDKKISDAVNYIMNEFDIKERNYPISLLMENIAEDAESEHSLKSALSLWVHGEKHGWVFDNKTDNFEIDNFEIIGIDGTEFLNDTEVGSVMSFYILWRVMDIRDGRRLGIWIDEAWQWIKDDYTSEEVHNSFKTNRKNNNFMVLGMQSVEDFLKNKSARAIIEESANIILFANPKANEEDYMSGLKCSEEEYLRVKHFNPSEFNCLIKRDEGSVIATIDLSGMEDIYLKILSTNKTDVENIKKIYENDDFSQEEKFLNLKAYFKG